MAAIELGLLIAVAVGGMGCGRLLLWRRRTGRSWRRWPERQDRHGEAAGDAAPDPDLLVYSCFDGDPLVTTSDSRGLLDSGTCSLDRCPTATTGVVGGAYLFDGVDDYILVPSNPLLDFGDQGQPFSVSMWYRAADLTPPAQQVLMSQSTTGGSVSYQLSLEPWQAGSALDLVWKVCETGCQSGAFCGRLRPGHSGERGSWSLPPIPALLRHDAVPFETDRVTGAQPAPSN